jgi:hypothetical protein
MDIHVVRLDYFLSFSADIATWFYILESLENDYSIVQKCFS